MYLYATLISALALDVGYWGITNILNLRGVPLGIWVESTEIAADIGLTLGTVTLAMAGLLQSRAAGIQLWLAGKQADREDAQLKVARALTKPHLDFQVIETSEKPTTQETFVLLQDRWFIRALLRNLGPGVAVDVQVTAFNWVIGQQRLDEELANLDIDLRQVRPERKDALVMADGLGQLPGLVAGHGPSVTGGNIRRAIRPRRQAMGHGAVLASAHKNRGKW